MKMSSRARRQLYQVRRFLLQCISPEVMLWTAPPPARECHADSKEPIMQTITTIGLDIDAEVRSRAGLLRVDTVEKVFFHR
jgi:hypothetical protein